jgi:hypothetical protein
MKEPRILRLSGCCFRVAINVSLFVSLSLSFFFFFYRSQQVAPQFTSKGLFICDAFWSIYTESPENFLKALCRHLLRPIVGKQQALLPCIAGFRVRILTLPPPHIGLLTTRDSLQFSFTSHTGMHRITTFRSTTDSIYDSGPIRVWY